MNPRRLFNLLIALIVAAGPAFAPLEGPAFAKSYHAAFSGQTHAMDGDTQAMADGMPCCPDEGKAAKDCNSCPLMALCSLTMPMPAPSGSATSALSATAETIFALPDDLLIDGLSAPPPDHPPRTIV